MSRARKGNSMTENAGRGKAPQVVSPLAPRIKRTPSAEKTERDLTREGRRGTIAAFPLTRAAGHLVPRRETRRHDDVLAVILTCRDGTPLEALTRSHCLATLPFAGHYRNIDFALSNCLNSGIHRAGVVTQFKAHALMQQVRKEWSGLWPEGEESIELWPAQRCRNDDCYRGTADAAYQNIHIIREHAPTHVLILAGDHLCRMNYAQVIAEHRRRGAEVTVGYLELAAAEAGQGGVLEVDADRWVRSFVERPLSAANARDDAQRALVSVGVYVFDTNTLIDLLRRDSIDSRSWHDIGHDLIPAALAAGLPVLGHPFRDAATGDADGCRNVATVDGYWRANMEQLAERPRLDLRDTGWPICTRQTQMPPARFRGRGIARQSIVCGGCVVAGEAHHSLLSVGCEVGAHTLIEDSVILPNVRIGRGCRIRRAIIDAGSVIADATVIDAASPRTAPGYISPMGIMLFASATVSEPLDPTRRLDPTGRRPVLRRADPT